MEHTEIAVLDEKESKLARQLESFGLSSAAARIIVCLAVRADATIREIGASTRLSTASVSMTLKKLAKGGIVNTHPAGAAKRNAPKRFYLTGDLDHVLSIIEAGLHREVSGYIRQTSHVKRQLASRFRPPSSDI